MSIFTGVDIVTLGTWLTEAQAAYNSLQTGALVVSIATGDERVTFTAAQVDQLRQYINELINAIAALAGTTRRKGVYITGGKGL